MRGYGARQNLLFVICFCGFDSVQPSKVLLSLLLAFWSYRPNKGAFDWPYSGIWTRKSFVMLQISCAVIFWPLKLQSSGYLISSRFLVITKQRTPKLLISRVCSIYSDSEIRSIEHALRLSVPLIYSVTNCEQQQQRILQRLKELPTQTAAP